MKRTLPTALILGFSASVPARSAPQCPDWSAGFHAPGVDGEVYSLLRHDDGSGEVVYIGGRFTSAGGVPAHNVARWDGSTWSAVGDGPSGVVFALAVYDDGNGPELYAGGQPYFTGTAEFLERFDGTTWTSIPVTGGISSLAVHDDGNGDALYVGGLFTSIGGLSTSGIARYDGSWSDLDGGLPFTGSGSWVRALASHDDGTGSKLFVTGRFGSIGGVGVDHIASWDGNDFAPLGSGIQLGSYGEGGYALQSFDDGLADGVGLYVCGEFVGAGGVASSSWARWSASGWQAVPGWPGFSPRCMAVVNEAGSDVLYTATAFRLLRFDGAASTLYQVGADTEPRAMVAFDSGGGEALHMGSALTAIGDVFPTVGNSLVRWNGAGWDTVSDGAGVATSALKGVEVLATFDFGSGPELVAGGDFGAAGGRTAPLVARFDGQEWQPIGDPSGVNLGGRTVLAMTTYDDGNGPALFAAGEVGALGSGVLARFDGTAWGATGGGPGIGLGFDRICAMTTFREAGDTNLFIGGDFLDLGSNPARFVARWDGTAWSEVGLGLDGPGGTVSALTVHDDGGGLALYAAGDFETADGTPVANVARWDGTAWAPVGGGLPGEPAGFLEGVVCVLEVFDSPQGEVLVAGGNFHVVDGAPADALAVWDGATWSALGTGLGGTEPTVTALASHDPDGGGERLYVTGDFETAGGIPTTGGAVWDGSAWSDPIDVQGLLVRDMVAFDAGEGRGLYLGGSFSSVAGVPAFNVARLTDACGLDLGIPRCTSLPNSSGTRGRLRADGVASVAGDDVTLSALDLPPGAGTLFFHGPRAARVPFGEGLRCVSGGLQRIYPIGPATGGTYELDLDYAAPYASDYVAGAALLFQGWYRDGMGGPAGFNTTDALEISFRP